MPTTQPPKPPDLESGAVWFYTRGQEIFGPVSFARLVSLQLASQLAADELVWQPHFPDWRPVASVPGLRAGLSLLPIEIGQPAPLSPAEKFPLLILIGFTVFVILHFALQDKRLSAQILVGRSGQSTLNGSTYEVEVCHDAKVASAFVAVGYFDSARGDWLTRGWYPTASGECQILLRGVPGPVFVFAESPDGSQTWLTESPLRSFCVNPRQAFLQPQSLCREFGNETRWQDFMALELPRDSGRVTWRLKEASDE